MNLNSSNVRSVVVVSALLSMVGALSGCVGEDLTVPDQAAIAEAAMAQLAPVPSTGALITNEVLQLGVNPAGHLNVPGGSLSSGMYGTTTVGLRYLPINAEGAGIGLKAEGWGVADGMSLTTGYTSIDAGGSFNVKPISFSTTTSTAMSVVTVGQTFKVTHTFQPSPVTKNLYAIGVSIKNISNMTVGDLRYIRSIDFDVLPNTFSEYMTINGTESAANVMYADDNPFASVNPLGPRIPLFAAGDREDSGPQDGGVRIDFQFGALVPGQTRSFLLFYGAAGNEEDAMNALSLVNAEVYGLGQSNWDGTGDPLSDDGAPPGTFGATTGGPVTFIIAARGVGGGALL